MTYNLTNLLKRRIPPFFHDSHPPRLPTVTTPRTPRRPTRRTGRTLLLLPVSSRFFPLLPAPLDFSHDRAKEELGSTKPDFPRRVDSPHEPSRSRIKTATGKFCLFYPVRFIVRTRFIIRFRFIVMTRFIVPRGTEKRKNRFIYPFSETCS